MSTVLPGQEPLAYNGVLAPNPPNLLTFANAPLPGYVHFNVGDLGIVPTAGGALYYLQSFSGSPQSNNFVANWVNLSGGGGVFTSLAVSGAITAGTTITAGTGITSTTGNITATAGQVNAGTSMSAGTTITAGTGLIATTGNIVASAGNLEATGVGTGLLLDPTVVAAGASPQTANGRAGQVTFSGVSIAAGATQSFVINNTSIAAIGTVILYSMVGATTGAALTIESVTNVAGTSSTIVVTNGTGATTTTANITFTYLVLN